MYNFLSTCPVVNRKNSVPNGAYWQCHDMDCRFQVEGVCAPLAGLEESREANRKLTAIMQHLDMLPR